MHLNMKTRSYCIVGVFLISILSAISGDQGGADIDIDYTIENTITGDDREFQFTLSMTTPQRDFFDIMKEAKNLDGHFKFKFKNFQGLGAYITEVNKLHEEEDVYFWAVLIRNATGDFFTPVGVSSLIPKQGDHVVLSYYAIW